MERCLIKLWLFTLALIVLYPPPSTKSFKVAGNNKNSGSANLVNSLRSLSALQDTPVSSTSNSKSQYLSRFKFEPPVPYSFNFDINGESVNIPLELFFLDRNSLHAAAELSMEAFFKPRFVLNNDGMTSWENTVSNIG